MTGRPDGPQGDLPRWDEAISPADQFTFICQWVAATNRLSPTTGWLEFPGGAYLYAGFTPEETSQQSDPLSYTYLIENIDREDTSSGFRVLWMTVDAEGKPHQDNTIIKSSDANIYLDNLVKKPEGTPEEEQEAFRLFFESIVEDVRIQQQEEDPEVTEINDKRLRREINRLCALITAH